MRVRRHLAASLIAVVIATEPELARAQPALTISPGSVVRLRNRSLAPCADSGRVVAFQRDSVVVELPLAGASVGARSLDCRMFARHVVDVADLEVWRGPSRGAMREARRGLLWGPIGFAAIGTVAASQGQRPEPAFGAAAGAVLGIFLGPLVGGIVGSLTASEEWVPASAAARPR
jgi:hypothetical protein